MHPLFFISKSNDALFYIYVNLFFNAFVVNKKFFANKFYRCAAILPGFVLAFLICLKPLDTNLGVSLASKREMLFDTHNNQ